ncbi:MAG TPA: hypothetical protein VK123_09455 [Candidatus Limnocylindrales bacterium]|nr:hypothetical protein [Candidatus Limnocylindrales bacterium]
MKLARLFPVLGGLATILLVAPSPVQAQGNPMALVGTLAPWPAGEYSNVAADATRRVAYMGSFDDQGVAVIDIRDPANPVLTDRLSTHIAGDLLTSDSADLDRVGHYLAVSHQAWSSRDGYEGISVYDIGPDPYHPALLRRISIPGGVHTVQIDSEVESGRPYAYANSEGNLKLTIVNILTGETLSQYASSEGIGCVPPPPNCQGFNFAHEGFIQRHPRSGRVLDYVSYWDSGLRIVDVTNPGNPIEVGAFDYNFFTNGLRSAHYAAATPSANWVYLEDEIGLLETGGVHVLDTSACDGTAYCTPALVGGWHIQGHPVQASALNAIIHSGQVNGAIAAAFKKSFSYDAHNLDVRGENELLLGNYAMGIRLIDTSDKTAPVQSGFFLPNANESEACKMDCGFNMRQTWGAYFGSDGRIYASDIGHGFFVVEERSRGGGQPAGSLAGAIAAGGGQRQPAHDRSTTPVRLRSVAEGSGSDFAFAFTTEREGAVRIAVYDVRGRLVSAKAWGSLAAGEHSVSWAARATPGCVPPHGIYFARVRTGKDSAAIKFVR